MQTEVPTLPVVHFNAHENPNRKENSNLRRAAATTLEAKTNVPLKNGTCFSSNKKNLHPLIGRPYQNSVRRQHSSERFKYKKDSIGQRVLSAKMLRVKELQNQLADAHYQLNELANENKLLKALQKRQDSALKRYEGTDAELPRIINSHHEELRVLRVKYKKLKVIHKETCDLLKERENELQQLQSQNKHLVQLSKDRNLGEREKLQLQVVDLNRRIEQQQDTIRTLHRKLTLESKSLKHQLQLEISKRKETQKYLGETIEKLRGLEHLLDNRERRLYHNGQLSFPNKNRQFGTQSLTNLRDIGSSNPLKLSDGNRKLQTEKEEDSLPVLRASDSNDKIAKADERINLRQTSNSTKTETMTNLEQVRRYRLQKSSHGKISLDDSEEKPNELDLKISQDPEKETEETKENDIRNQYEINADKFRTMCKSRRRYQDFNELPREEFTYSTGSSESENKNFEDVCCTDAIKNSKKSQIRLINDMDDDTFDSKDSALPDSEYQDKLKVLVHERKASYESDSEVEPEVRENYLSSNRLNGAFKLSSSLYDDDGNHYDSDKEIESFAASNLLSGSQRIYQNLIGEMQMRMKNVENKHLYDLQYDIDNISRTKTTDTEHLKDNANIYSKDLENSAVDTEEENNDTSSGKNEIKEASMLETLSMKQHNQLETSFKASDNIEPVNIHLEKLKGLSIAADDGRITNKVHENGSKIIYVSANNSNVETKNKLNNEETSSELENVDSLLNSGQSCETDSTEACCNDKDDETSSRKKVINYNKEKLLATMRAIDDNENIEFLNQDYNKHNVISRKQITENLFRGVPTHAKKKQDIIKDIFETDGIRNEPAGSCNKLRSYKN